MKELYRILDANFNRAREALRVAEDCGRFVLNDPAVTAMAKNLRSDLREVLTDMPVKELIVSRDAPGDTGSEFLSSPERLRPDIPAGGTPPASTTPTATNTAAPTGASSKSAPISCLKGAGSPPTPISPTKKTRRRHFGRP